MVNVQDVHGLVHGVVNVRDYQMEDGEEPLLRLGLDGGQGFFKVCINVMKSVQEFEEAKTFTSDAKEGSVKGLFVLTIVPDIEELYQNVKICLDSIEGLKDLPYVVATDLKLANVLAGLQSHGAQHPCSYCEGTVGVWEQDAIMRTLGNIRKKKDEWIKEGAKLAEGKNFKNCVNDSLLHGMGLTRI